MIFGLIFYVNCYCYPHLLFWFSCIVAIASY